MLTALLPPERIRVPLGSHSRHALFRELVELALPEADPATLETVFQSVLAREAESSTAIGDGLAVPHGRTDVLAGIRMAAGIAEGLEDYQAPDGAPVRVCVLVVTPERDAGMHLNTGFLESLGRFGNASGLVRGRLARLMRNEPLRRALFGAETALEFAGVLAHAEQA